MRFLGEFVFEGEVTFGDSNISMSYYIGLDFVLKDGTTLHIIKWNRERKIYLKVNEKHTIRGEVLYDEYTKKLFLNIFTLKSNLVPDIESKNEQLITYH